MVDLTMPYCPSAASIRRKIASAGSTCKRTTKPVY